MNTKKIHIGTSGWHYGHWENRFYPRGTRKKEFLKFYSSVFDTVEINNSFYNLPGKKTFTAWKKTVPRDFLFSVKASRYITHMKKLTNPEQSLKKFFERIKGLGKKLGPVLFQLPPSWKRNPGRLENFINMLPKRHRYAFEFRDTSWFDEKVYRILSAANAAFCIYELGEVKSPYMATADFIYIRLHGPSGRYKGSYTGRKLGELAGRFAAWRRQKKEIYCYFDNDQAAYAAKNARNLKKITERR